MQAEINILKRDTNKLKRVKNRTFSEAVAYRVWIPNSDEELIVLKHNAQKIRISGKVTIK